MKNDANYEKATDEELRALGTELGEKAAKAKGPTQILLPLGGLDKYEAAGGPWESQKSDRVLFDAIHAAADGKRHALEDSLHEIRPARVHRHAGERAACIRVVDGAPFAHEIRQEINVVFAELFVGDIRLFARKVGRF